MAIYCAFFQRDYWSRVSIVKEVALPAQLSFRFRSIRLPLADFYSFLRPHTTKVSALDELLDRMYPDRETAGDWTTHTLLSQFMPLRTRPNNTRDELYCLFLAQLLMRLNNDLYGNKRSV